jgi:hypothetical protein
MDVNLKRRLLKYLKKSGRLRTLEALREDLKERKPARLSFVIQKQPEKIKPEKTSPKTEKKTSNPKIEKGLKKSQSSK